MWTIRGAGSADYDAFFRLDQQCFAPGIAYSRADFRAFLSQRRNIVFLAEHTSAALLGFILAGPRRKGEARHGYIITIDVAESARRQGVGRALLSAVERRFQEDHLKTVRLEVAADNYGAQKFYEQAQYRRIGRIPGYYLGTIDALVMEKSLDIPAPGTPF